jgi:hypothetical protein
MLGNSIDDLMNVQLQICECGQVADVCRVELLQKTGIGGPQQACAGPTCHQNFTVDPQAARVFNHP